MRLSVGVASVNLVQSPVLPCADAVEAGVAGLRRYQRLGGRGALGGRGVAGQGGHGVRLGLGEGQPVMGTVRTTAEAAVELAEREVAEETLRLPRRTTVGLKTQKRSRGSAGGRDPPCSPDLGSPPILSSYQRDFRISARPTLKQPNRRGSSPAWIEYPAQLRPGCSSQSDSSRRSAGRATFPDTEI